MGRDGGILTRSMGKSCAREMDVKQHSHDMGGSKHTLYRVITTRGLPSRQTDVHCGSKPSTRIGHRTQVSSNIHIARHSNEMPFFGRTTIHNTYSGNTELCTDTVWFQCMYGGMLLWFSTLARSIVHGARH